VLILLPPSETKREDGTEGTTLDEKALSFPSLRPQRRAVIAATARLSRNLRAAATALKLGPKQAEELRRNRVIRSSPVLPAIDRYTGVLYDALDSGSLDPASRSFAAEHLAIGSALFGLVGALDEIPSYRLSYDARLPGVSLKKLWRDPISAILAERPGLLLDLRSEGYAALGPIPIRPDAVYVRVVSEGDGGRRLALNHFNKSGKGAFTRRLLQAGIDHPDVESLLSWAAGAGIELERGAPGELDLVV
jgi:cytoplasmic iron level regulating protein YaaA (DUF328/UPF0246 family)